MDACGGPVTQTPRDPQGSGRSIAFGPQLGAALVAAQAAGAIQVVEKFDHLARAARFLLGIRAGV